MAMITSPSPPVLDAPATPVAPRPPRGGLLCVANFPSNTGYAWDFIESVYGSLADHFETAGVTTWVAYPRLDGSAAVLRDTAAVATELDVRLGSWRCLVRVLAFVRRNRIRAVYMSDRAAWHPAHLLLRLAGVRWIVVHDHTSGSRTAPTGLKRVLKRYRAVLRGALADRVVAVSDYVARRKAEVDLVPLDRVARIWNSRPVTAADPAARDRLRAFLGVDSGPIVACSCRATPEKGVAHLLRAFDRYCAAVPAGVPHPTLVYFGDGPGLPALRRLHRELPASASIVLAGYRDDAVDLLAGADVCVVPSIWQEAFGLAVLEPMTYGIPVIASRVGGIPELIVHGETGLLTEPGDEAGIEDALRLLLTEPGERQRLGANAFVRAQKHFSRDQALGELVAVIEPAFRAGTGR